MASWLCRHGTDVLAQQLKQQSDYLFAAPAPSLRRVARLVAPVNPRWVTNASGNTRCRRVKKGFSGPLAAEKHGQVDQEIKQRVWSSEPRAKQRSEMV